MDKNLTSLLLSMVLAVGLAVPASATAWAGFPDEGEQTPTMTAYSFWTQVAEVPTEPTSEATTATTGPTEPTADIGPTGSTEPPAPTDPPPPPPPPTPVTGPVLVYNKLVDLYPVFDSPFLAGSDLYIPIAVTDTADPTAGTVLATDKNIKSDAVTVSYKVIAGADYVDAVTLVSGQKEKQPGLPAGMYAKIELANTYMPLDRSQLSIRLVLSVNGVSYQRTAVTVNCYLRNRLENIESSSVFGALLPMQFRISPRYGGDVSFDFGEGVSYTGTVSPNKRYYLNLDRTEKVNFAETYPGAYLEYYDFRGNNDTFASVGQLQIPVDTANFKEQKTSTELYVYEVLGDRLSSLGQNAVSYDYRTGKVTINAMTLGSYILSSRPLMQEVQSSKQWDILRSGYAEAA
jgi:hypothetical protein